MNPVPQSLWDFHTGQTRPQPGHQLSLSLNVHMTGCFPCVGCSCQPRRVAGTETSAWLITTEQFQAWFSV